MAALHRGLVWQRTSPTAQQPDGPVLYQIIFRTSATPGNIPVVSAPHTLANSPISVGGGNVAIGGLSGHRSTGIISLAGGQTLPAARNVPRASAGPGPDGGPLTRCGALSSDS